jgi:D-inositol-3-phosphate glycosyltransferase
MVLLDACKENIRLIVLGGFGRSSDSTNYDELERLKHLAEDLGLSNQVSFDTSTDPDKLPYYYAAADLLVNTPVLTGLGITPLEAMACGTPVIGSEVGAIKFAVVDGKTGFIIPPKAPQLLADRVRLVLKNDVLLAQMSRNSVKHANSSFTWIKVVEQMIELYEYVLLTKTKKTPIFKSANMRNMTSAVRSRELYLRRNMQAKYPD